MSWVKDSDEHGPLICDGRILLQVRTEPTLERVLWIEGVGSVPVAEVIALLKDAEVLP